MTSSSPQPKLAWDQNFFLKNFRIPLLTLVALIAVGWLGFQFIQRNLKSSLSETIKAVHLNSIEVVRIWSSEKTAMADVWANNQVVRQEIQRLVHRIKTKDLENKKTLHHSRELQTLRKVLGPLVNRRGMIGFVVLDTSGLQIAALLDEPIGKRTLMARSDFVRRTLAGETVLSLPFLAGVDLPDKDGNFEAQRPTMFVSAPVRGEKGEVIAALSFRIRPEQDFNRILNFGRLSSTGESYAFDSNGRFLSDSRFSSQIQELNLTINPNILRTSLNLDIRNPGGNLTKGFIPQIPRKEQPLTKMAASALEGESGIDIEGYNDYRGVPVVGAWTWISDLGFGVATEIDLEEVYAPLHEIIWLFGSLFALIVVGWSVSVFIRTKHLQEQSSNIQLGLSLKESRNRTEVILENTVDAIISINQNGIIDQFNLSAEKTFGYQRTEIVGKNINLLMPEPYHSEHDGYLSRYLLTGEAHIINIGREVVGLKKDGTTFPMHLSISEVEIEQGRLFTGIVRDITQQKMMEEKNTLLIESLKEANQELEEFTYRTSHDLRAPLVNMRGLSQIMQEDLKEGDYVEVSDNIGKIKTLATKLESLVGNILEVAKINHLEEKAEKIDVAKEVELIKDKLNILIHQKNVEVLVTGDETIPVEIQKSIFIRVLENLISNAVKYSDPEKDNRYVKIEVSKSEQGTQIQVSDNGLGIPKKFHEETFGMFKRFHKSSSFGSGLGLYLVKKNIQKINATITMDSSDKGTTFTIVLPEKKYLLAQA